MTETEISNALDIYVRWMRASGFSERTVGDRLAVLHRLQQHLAAEEVHPTLARATAEDLASFSDTFATLAASSRNVYVRHVKAFFKWAAMSGHIAADPAARLPVTRPPRGRPHPTRQQDLELILLCTQGPLRLAYALAAFAGLRCGEICKLRTEDIIREVGRPVTANIRGKGGKQRTVPVLASVLAEIDRAVGDRRGYLLLRPDGGPWGPRQLSCASSYHLADLGIQTTLHSMRAAFATSAYAATRDPLLVRDLLGHASVQTTEVYMASSVWDAGARLGAIADTAASMLT
jgi:integrase